MKLLLLFTTFSLLLVTIIDCYYDDYDDEEDDNRGRGPPYYSPRRQSPLYYGNRIFEADLHISGTGPLARAAQRRHSRHQHYRDHINSRSRHISSYDNKGGDKSVFTDIYNRQKERHKKYSEELSRDWERRKNEVDTDTRGDRDDHQGSDQMNGPVERPGPRARKMPVLYSNPSVVKDEKIDPKANVRGRHRSLLPDVVEGIDNEEKVHGKKQNIPDITQVHGKPPHPNPQQKGPGHMGNIPGKTLQPQHPTNHKTGHQRDMSGGGEMGDPNRPMNDERGQPSSPNSERMGPNTDGERPVHTGGYWDRFNIFSRNLKRFFVHKNGARNSSLSIENKQGPIKMYSSLGEESPRRRSRKHRRRRSRRPTSHRRHRRHRRARRRPPINRRSHQRRGRGIRSFSGPTLEEENDQFHYRDYDLDGEIMNFRSNLPPDFFTISKPGEANKPDEMPVTPEAAIPPETPLPPHQEPPIPPQSDPGMGSAD